MAASSAKENILGKIRQALINPVPLPFNDADEHENVFTQAVGDHTALFESEFLKLQGKFIRCKNSTELAQNLSLLFDEQKWFNVYYREPWLRELLSDKESFSNLEACDVSVTGCECLVARTGTMVLSSGSESGRTTSVYAPVHICIAFQDQLVADLPDTFALLRKKYGQHFPSFITFASGPSRTADIEKTLVTGVHGPKEVFCFFVESNQ